MPISLLIRASPFSEGHTIGDTVRDELISRFDDVMDVLVHVDPEDDEGLFEHSKPLTRADVQVY